MDAAGYDVHMSKNKHGPSEKVVFNGYSYRRYPESPRRELRVYFARSGKQRVSWLHRDIWIHHNGPIPDGFHVHHIDGNPLNNEIENLAVMPEREHHQEHWTDEKRQWARENIRHAIAAAPAWHRSQEGRAWHADHARQVMANRQPTDLVCMVCRKAFKSLRPDAKFCGRNCQSRLRRKSGVDDVERVCQYCNATFWRNKYGKVQLFCSRLCSARGQAKARKNSNPAT